MTSADIPTSPNDPINTAILTVAEDKITGFRRMPFHAIADECGQSVETVIERLKAMQEAGVVRRVRQTLLATKLAQGALVAWALPKENLEAAFQWCIENDPFTGHVVTRTTDDNVPGAEYQLWTTLKVPMGSNTLEGHCDIIKKHIGAFDYVLLPAEGVFALSVGHMRRRGLKPGDKTPEPATMQGTAKVSLSDEEWKVLLCLKEQLTFEEMVEDPWQMRADALGMSKDHFCTIAEGLDQKRVIGRFATFLEHVKAKAHDGPVTKHNGLFHWTVPEGMEKQAGSECGRHICMTHCYWRSGGTPFGGAQIMGVVHGLERQSVLDHKAAIDQHLAAMNIPVLHTAVFWGTKSEIKPSEISPEVYKEWLESSQNLPSL